MDNKNIIFNHTLEQYNKKYRNRGYRLLKYTRKQVEDFDKQYGHYVFNNKTYSLEFNHYLLKDRKWWYIKDTETYYEIPRPIRFTWFRNLNTGVQIATCVLGAGIVASAVVVPTVLLNNENIVIFDTNNKDLELVKVEKDKDTNDTVITMRSKKDSVSVADVEVKKGDDVLKEHVDYSYNDATLEVRIHEAAMSKPGKITITPKVTDDIEHVNKQKWLEAYQPYSEEFEKYCASSLHYQIKDLEISGLFIDESGKRFKTNTHPFPIQYKTEVYTIETNEDKEINAFYVDFTKGSDAKMYKKLLGGGIYDYRVITKQVFEIYEDQYDIDYIINNKEKYVKYDIYEKGTKNLFNSVKFNSNGFVENTYANIKLGTQLLIKYNGAPATEEHVQQYAMAGAAGQIEEGKQTGSALYTFGSSGINFKKDCDYKFYLRTGIYDKVFEGEPIGLCKCGFSLFTLDGDVGSNISDLKISITDYEGLSVGTVFQQNKTIIYAIKDSKMIFVNEMDKDIYLSIHVKTDTPSTGVGAAGTAFPLE